MRARLAEVLVTALSLLPLASCGLISSDVDDFELSLPEKEFTVDTAAWGITQTGTFESVGCPVPVADCATAADSLCAEGACTGRCDAGFCAVDADVSLYNTVNLAIERPELADIDQQQGLRVRVRTIEFVVDENDLNVATPRLDLYAAPVTVLAVPDAGATLIGHMDPIPPGSRTTAAVVFEPGGKDALDAYMSNYTTAFNFLVAATVVVENGAPIPDGRVSGTITGAATADAF